MLHIRKSERYDRLFGTMCLVYSAPLVSVYLEKTFVCRTRHVFVKHGCPRRQQCQNMAKISNFYILTPPNPQGHGMSVKCEEPIDELTVQVWSLYHHPNFKYCTLFVSGTELRTDRQTDRRMDDPITRCPRRTFQAGGIKSHIYFYYFLNCCFLKILSDIMYATYITYTIESEE